MIKRIQSHEEIEKKKKRRTFILSMFMLIILVLSTLGYAFFVSPQDDSNQENQPPSQEETGKLSFKFNGFSFNLLSSKQEIEKISIEANITPEDYNGKILYVDSKNDLISKEISTTLGQISSRVQKACYGKCSDNLPEKTCKDNLIIFHESENKRVYQQDKCVFVEGDISSIDAFVYSLFNSYKI